jgi:hypothetical protein
MSWGATASLQRLRSPVRKLPVSHLASPRALGHLGQLGGPKQGQNAKGRLGFIPRLHRWPWTGWTPSAARKKLVFHGEQILKLQSAKQGGEKNYTKTIVSNASLIPVRCL